MFLSIPGSLFSVELYQIYGWVSPSFKQGGSSQVCCLPQPCSQGTCQQLIKELGVSLLVSELVKMPPAGNLQVISIPPGSVLSMATGSGAPVRWLYPMLKMP